MTNNMFKLFNLDNDTWEDITSSRHDITRLRFFGDNDVELTSSDFKVILSDLSFTYVFNSGVTCRKIIYNNIPIWNNTDDYPNFGELKPLSLDLGSNRFFVTNLNDQTKKVPYTHSLILRVTLSQYHNY